MRIPLMLGLSLAALLQGIPAAHAVDVDLSIRAPGIQLYIGDRDPNGRYWDGGRWRDERWWNENCHRYRDRRDFRGHCGPDRRDRREYREHHDEHRGPPPGHPHCPPGQAKKGLC